MISNNTKNFIITLLLFLIFAVGGSYITDIYEILKPKWDWIFWLGDIITFLFAFITIIGLLRFYLLNKSANVIQILMFVVSSGILLYYIFLAFFLLILNIWGFPAQD